jgi:hypothetical protein
MKTYMAIDQYGETYHDLGKFPRKALLERLGRSKAGKMYIDNNKGESFHCGWVIGNLWLTVYEVKPMRKAA